MLSDLLSTLAKHRRSHIPRCVLSRWIHGFHVIISGAFSDMVKLFLKIHLWRWIHGFHVIISGAFTEMAKLFLKIHLEMDTWFSCHHLWCLFRDGEAIFKDSSVVMDPWFSSHYLWPHHRAAAVVNIGSSMENVTWFSSHHLWWLLGRWCSLFQRIIYGDGNVVYKLSSLMSLQRWCIMFLKYHITGFQSSVCGAAFFKSYIAHLQRWWSYN